MLKPKNILILIIGFAFLIRLAGIGYGLPLWLIDDEPPFALAALKMIQLKTLLPATHLEEFGAVLYYPPYLSYLYLLPFSILLGWKYLFFSGGREQFIYYLTGDLSQFFLIARFLNVVMGVASVYLLYKIALQIFKPISGHPMSVSDRDIGTSDVQKVGLLSALFLSTSLFHILMSANGRHWLAVSFFSVLVLWILSLDWEFQKRYAAAVLAVGIGMGVSPINGLLLALIGYWYLFYEQRKIEALLREKYFYGSLIIFTLLTVLPGVLYPQSFGFRADLTLGQGKTIWGVILSPFLFLKPAALSEPILTVFAVLGFPMLFMKWRNIFWPLFLFIYTYSAVFYAFFRYEERFSLPLFPILALLAATGFSSIYKKINNNILKTIILYSLSIILFTLSFRLAYLMYRGDSRILLRNWAEENLPANSRIMVYSRLTRLSSSKEAIEEQKMLDPNSLRRVDIAEANLGNRTGKYFHALNLYDVNNSEFYGNLEKYIRDNNYQYLFIGGTDIREKEKLGLFRKIAEKGTLLKSFGEFQEVYSPSIGQLAGNPLNLFKLEEFGPPVLIYELNKKNY